MNTTGKQLVKSFLLGGIASTVEFIVFSLFQYLIFVKYSNVPFIFGPFDYEIADGGLCAFISNALSFLIAQIVNYFVQNRFAFKADKPSFKTFIKYFGASLVAYVVALYLPGVIGASMNEIFGLVFGPLVTKAVSMFGGFLAQFPINKFLVFKK